MGKIRLAVHGYKLLKLRPITIVISNLLATGTNRQKTRKLFDLGKCLFQLLNKMLALYLGYALFSFIMNKGYNTAFAMLSRKPSRPKRNDMDIPIFVMYSSSRALLPHSAHPLPRLTSPEIHAFLQNRDRLHPKNDSLL